MEYAPLRVDPPELTQPRSLRKDAPEPRGDFRGPFAALEGRDDLAQAGFSSVHEKSPAADIPE